MAVKYPKKSNYIQRAHSNPFLDHNITLPSDPWSFDWSDYFTNNKAPTILDLGCGYGKFTFFIAEKFKECNVVGMEIRKKVVNYVNDKIKAEKSMLKNQIVENEHKNNDNENVQTANKYNFDNIAAIHTNGMVFLQNFFCQNSLDKIFILFPDPHFKKKKKKARIVCKQMIDIYSYVLKMQGKIYISSDVKELFDSMRECFENHPDFVVNNEDDLFSAITCVSDEATRAGVKTGCTFGIIFKKVK
ncbi:tRNA (guanine-N(7)-)-methyltransferase [Conglomerata obtusa]